MPMFIGLIEGIKEKPMSASLFTPELAWKWMEPPPPGLLKERQPPTKLTKSTSLHLNTITGIYERVIHVALMKMGESLRHLAKTIFAGNNRTF